MLSVSSISRHYGDLKAVDNVSFSVERGEIVGLLGHNGAGKTTIMKMLTGCLEPDEGSISINDADATRGTALSQHSLGYLPESPPIYPELSVLDYLDYSAELKGLSGDIKHAEIKRTIESAELSDKLVTPIGTLSRGFKQRVGVAQAILGHPNLLILDEPTNGLDPSQTEQMRALVRRLSSESTIILSTHIMQEVEAICDRVLIIQHGQLIIDSALDQLTQSDRIHLSTNADIKQISAILENVKDIILIEKLQDKSLSFGEDPASNRPIDYVLGLDDVLELSVHELIAVITRRMVESNYSVFGIRTDTRDLQRLFLELDTESSRPMIDNVGNVDES